MKKAYPFTKPKFFLFSILLFCSIQGYSQCILTLSPNAADGKDANIWNLPCSSSYAISNSVCDTTNFGDIGSMGGMSWTWWGTPADVRALIEFNLDSLASLGCLVSHATLVLHHDGSTGQFGCGSSSSLHPCNDNSIKISRATSSWNESTVIWPNQPSVASTVLGQDYVNVTDNSNPYPTYNIDITTMVNYWLQNPGTNYGMQIALASETYYSRVRFATSDHPDPSLRPQLVLELACSNYCSNLLEGDVFHDLNSNCIQDIGESGLQNWIVKATPGPFYANTDSNGHYSIWSPNTNMTIDQIIPNNYIWDSICPLPYEHFVSGMSVGDTVSGLDFAINADHNCPQLTVDLGTTFLRVCHTEPYFVEYCNTGNLQATGVYIDVTFDSLLTPTLSSLPWQSVTPIPGGNTYTFWIDTLDPGECGDFYMNVHVDCGVSIGDNFCTEAIIYPYYSCDAAIDSSWDHSSVSVEGDCIDSMACFTITNTGSPINGNMLGPSEFRIYENGTLVFVGTFQLLGGQDTVICWPGNGNTITLQADQRPGHPGNSHPNDVVEDCGFPGTVVLPNLQNTFPPDDGNAYSEIECEDVIASYDPNDKTVVPLGVYAPHYIKATDELEYKIRFQNTGNDTAFNIVIRDTLPIYLDPATIVSGVSSHNYNFQLSGARLATWTFNNILLVDSGTNEPMSHGFVKFKIKQVANNAPGTIIQNRAGIFFDFNAPVLTDYAFNTIWIPEGLIGIEPVDPVTVDFGMIIYPNPTINGATIEWSNSNYADYSIELFDLLGRKIKSISPISFNKAYLETNDLGSGIYLVQLRNHHGSMQTKKIVISH